MTHTPGPWTIQRWIKRDETGWALVGGVGKEILKIMHVAWQGTLANDNVSEEDFALIAAAPEQQAKIDALLAACKAALETIEDAVDGEWGGVYEPPFESIIAQLRAAIAKAEGK